MTMTNTVTKFAVPYTMHFVTIGIAMGAMRTDSDLITQTSNTEFTPSMYGSNVKFMYLSLGI